MEPSSLGPKTGRASVEGERPRTVRGGDRGRSDCDEGAWAAGGTPARHGHVPQPPVITVCKLSHSCSSHGDCPWVWKLLPDLSLGLTSGAPPGGGTRRKGPGLGAALAGVN